MKNKRMFLITALSLLVFAAAAQVKPFTIKGKTGGKTNRTIYLQYKNGVQKVITDSAKITNGAFIFKGTVDGVTAGRVLSELGTSPEARAFEIFVSPGSQMLTIPAGDFSNGFLTGTAVAEELKRFKEFMKDVQPQMDKLLRDYYAINSAMMSATANKDDATVARLKTDLGAISRSSAELSKQAQQKKLEFMNKYPDSYVTASLLSENLQMPDLRERYAKLSPGIKESNVGKELKKGMDKDKLGTVGTVAAQFASTELRGEKLSLADYKGRYVLLDFWASWCIPCRKGNPHLLKLYSEYKEKGFEIIGISDDDNAPEKWKKAVEEDQIGVWKHVLHGLKKLPGSGFKFDNTNSILDKYNISVLPTKILIDPNGVIIGRYGSDEALDKKLAEVFN